jgi:sulfatase modifying factor 1
MQKMHISRSIFFSCQLLLAFVCTCCLLPLSAQDSTYTETVNGVSFKMVRVEGGTFTMGCTAEQGGDCLSDEKPSHRVTLSDYWIGETEVTQVLWRAVMGSNPSYYSDCDDCPVEMVGWEEAQNFIRKLNSLTGKRYRLPTEAEWEYAARGGGKSQGHKYSGSNEIGEVAWYGDNSEERTHAVKRKKANELSLYDMTGNVWEWCSDWCGDYTPESQTNPTGPAEGSSRVFRGGGWNYDPRDCRVYNRNDFFTHDFRFYLGLRLASQ